MEKNIEPDFGGRPLKATDEKYGAIIRHRITGTIGMIAIVDMSDYSVYIPSKDDYFFLPHSEVNLWEVIIE